VFQILLAQCQVNKEMRNVIHPSPGTSSALIVASKIIITALTLYMIVEMC